ncbi:bacteriohemerythrin [Pleomorphomonas sp. NRK KF1]|uniref:bacteriohemerythrin n=1 Tax=Pleomorphomonas sp. NRK KF1 TaxID=2943000 RepID=UPI0020443304|nr:bacteriohemerythrin [Pleomorphomonas sp. NRK KF1]MCM5553919.1 bacteriohemerythrin [Pleomorphomonas sp. NRK KF1]
MPIMEWNEKLSVGVASLDNDHKKLVALVNELYDAIQAGKGADKLGPVLDSLISYTVFHFQNEEKFFAQTGYPASAAHKQEHEALTKQAVAIQTKFKSGAAGTLTLEVMNFLRNWLINHIQGSDKKYGPHLNAQGIK